MKDKIPESVSGESLYIFAVVISLSVLHVLGSVRGLTGDSLRTLACSPGLSTPTLGSFFYIAWTAWTNLITQKQIFKIYPLF